MKTYTDTELVNLVTDAWLETGKALTVAELAALPDGPSGATWRKRLDTRLNAGRFELQCVRVERPVRERNYNTVVRYAPVYAWQPSMDHIRQLLRATRGHRTPA